jgi:hypothetical protein
MKTINTPYGTATIGEDWCSIKAEHHQLYDWANRPGAHWPCSELAHDVDSIEAGFDSGGLIDLRILPGEPEDLMGDELSAWTSDVLEIAGLPADHPCYLVCVGQFQEARS